MDIIFERTKLQAIVVLNLISNNLISKKFIFEKDYKKDINEDSEKNDFFYKMLEEKAFYTTHLVEKKGLIRCSLQVYLLSILAFLSTGKFYLAAIRSYAFSIAAKLNPLLKIVTDSLLLPLRQLILIHSRRMINLKTCYLTTKFKLNISFNLFNNLKFVKTKIYF